MTLRDDALACVAAFPDRVLDDAIEHPRDVPAAPEREDHDHLVEARHDDQGENRLRPEIRPQRSRTAVELDLRRDVIEVARRAADQQIRQAASQATGRKLQY
jgi:hypothetical protein